MLGISLSLNAPLLSTYILPTTFILGLLAIFYRSTKPGQILLLVFTLCVGALLGMQHLTTPETPHIRGFISTPMTVTCSGTITESLSSNQDRVKIILKVDTLFSQTPLRISNSNSINQTEFKTKHTSQPLRDNLFMTPTYGMIQLSMPAFPHQHLSPGDHIILTANLSPPRGFVNPGGFNLPFFLRSQNILISGWVQKPENIIQQRSTANPWEITIQAEKIRSKLIDFFNSSLPKTMASLYRALITGDRSGLPLDIQEMFKNLGLFHLLAISGLHMGFLAGFVMWGTIRLMRLFPNLLLHIPAQQGSAFLAMLPIIFYCIISGLHPPAVRACIMTLVLFSAFIFRSQWHGPTAIAIAALILLIHNPLILGMVSFQLSFIAVTAIVFILPKIKNHFFTTHTAHTKPSLFTTIKRTILSGLLLSFVASIATLPLLLFHFNRVSLVSPFTTLLIEPLLCIWALGFGLAGSALSFVLPDLASILLHLGAYGFKWSLWLCNIMNQVPYINLWFPTPAVWEIIAFYFSLFLFAFFNNTKSAILVCICLGAIFIPQQRNLNCDRVTIIDVGKGNSSLIECTTGETILLDCGGPNNAGFNVGRQIIGPLLFHKQIRNINLLILSHADLDHYSGATFLLNQFQIKELWVPYLHADNEQWNTMIKTAQEKNTTIIIPKPRHSYMLKNNRHLVNISSAHITKKDWSQNDQSLVTYFSSGKYSFLFPGDIEAQAEKLLIQQKIPLESTVIVAPHHGSKSSSTLPFLHQVKPEYVLFSSSLFGRNMFPAEIIEKRYFNIGSKAYKTARNGAITLKLAEDGLGIKTCIP